ncbi:MAG TPA: hypothetical protein DDW45_07940 [Gammaproteobacteria bacterium]|nr:hypothetical protein [Gammaproteobacteria bacterium]
MGRLVYCQLFSEICLERIRLGFFWSDLYTTEMVVEGVDGFMVTARAIQQTETMLLLLYASFR